jgi:hypothetical protein
MRIRMSATYFTVDVLYVSSATYKSTLSGFTITTFCSRAAFGGEERVCGTPHTPARALPSALPTHLCPCTAYDGEERNELEHSTPRQRALPSALPFSISLISALFTHQGLREFQAIWPGAIRLAYLVRVCAN